MTADEMQEYINKYCYPSGPNVMAGPTYNPAPEQGREDWTTPGSLRGMIAMRLRVANTEKLGGVADFVQCYKSGETVFVFVVKEDKSTVIEDSAGLFPSDTLITQLKLLRG